MSVPTFEECMKPLLVLIADGDEHDMRKLTRAIAEQFELTDDDLAMSVAHGKQQLIYDRVSWARTYLKKAGLVDSSHKGSIHITERGREVLADNPEKIDCGYLCRFPEYVEWVHACSLAKAQRKGQKAANDMTNEETSAALTPNEQLEQAYREINESLASDILDEMLSLSPHAFEKLVVDLLLRMGYGAAEFGSEATQLSGDDGIDGVIMEDKLGFSLIYIQAKKWARDQCVSQPDVQSFVGAIAGKHGNGLFVATCRFSQKAQEYAQLHHIILIDGERLANLAIEYDFCMKTRTTYKIMAIDEDAFAEYKVM